MNLTHIWTMTKKDMGLFLRKKYTLFVTIIIPIGLSIGLPLLVKYIIYRNPGIEIQTLTPRIDAFSFFFVILASIIPLTLATYSIVGEKVEKSLEPLLATPTTDSELLLGKFLAAFIPCIGIIAIGAGIFMGFMNAVIFGKFGSNYFLNLNSDLIFFLLVPLAAIFSVEFCVIISSRVSDIRSAQLLSSLVLIPMLVIYVLLEIDVISLEYATLSYVAGAFGLLDLLLFFISKSLFQREEILTRWK